MVSTVFFEDMCQEGAVIQISRRKCENASQNALHVAIHAPLNH